MLRSMMVVGCALALCACTEEAVTTADASEVDSGSMGSDASSMRADAGPMDECAASGSNAASTVGCNGGFVSGEPEPNEPGGICTTGGETNPGGTCTHTSAVCAPATEGASEGRCVVGCPPSMTYVTTGDCPTGFRCFRAAEEYGICYLDCDATHPCPTGTVCDSEGSCVPEEEEPMDDGGVPDGGMMDGAIDETDGAIDDDGGMLDPDAGVNEHDSGLFVTEAGVLPDAGLDAGLPAI